ncbi:maestro heat-like repeat-containing protein family member 2A [Columba livia]|uniref:maestro heat-like repeat-containing protein family member 2A n=1 Tax=Columba livia TaxID=8932 RepID=UPI0031BB3F58
MPAACTSCPCPTDGLEDSGSLWWLSGNKGKQVPSLPFVVCPQGDRVDTYRELEHALQGEDGCLPGGVVNRLIAEASGDLRAAQGVMDDVKMAASDFLVALARTHFYFVMAELQSHLKVVGKVPDEAVLVTLGKMAGSYALRCVPFAGATLLALRRTLSRAGSGRTLRIICGVLERWSKGITMYLCSQKRHPFPQSRAAQLCGDLYPLFHHAVVNWLGCKEEQDNRAVLGAVAAMVGVLVCEERHCQCAREQLLQLLRQHQRVQDTSRVTEVRTRAGPGVADRRVCAGATRCWGAVGCQGNWEALREGAGRAEEA